MSRKVSIGAVIAIVVLVSGLIGSRLVLADNTASKIGNAGDYYQAFISKLAGNLGIDQSKVSAAMETTKKQLLDEAVQKGTITQQQADKMAASKGWGFCTPGSNRGAMMKKGFGMTDSIPSILGISADQFQTELKSGRNLTQIITDHGMTVEQVKQKILDNERSKISQEVSDGKLTQVQADKMISNLEKRLADLDMNGKRGAPFAPKSK